MPSSTFGRSAETLVEKMLQKKGYRILERNFRIAGGELDFIAEHQGLLIFIEVKARRTGKYGGASYSIDSRKKRQIIRLASCYLSQRQLAFPECRFDAVLVSQLGNDSPTFTHLEHAFEVSSSDWQW